MASIQAIGRPSGILGAAPWGLSWPLLIAAALFAFLMRRPELLNDGDLYWHIRVGEWILRHLAIPRADSFTHSLPGAPWTAHEWLSDVVFALAFSAGGWTGTTICAAGAAAAALAMLARYLLRYLEPIYVLVIVALSSSLLAPHLLARPHTLMAPLLVLWGTALMGASDEGRAPRLRFLPAMALWANLHGSFVLGLALIVPFALNAVLAARPGARRRALAEWTGFGAAAAAAAMLTPLGPQGLLFAVQVSDMTFALSQIGEWRSPNFQALQPLELCLLLFAGAALTRGLRLPWLRVVLLLGLLHLALKHSRHADLLALLGPILLARPLGEQWRGPPAQGARLDRWFNALTPRASPASVAVVLILLAALALEETRRDALSPAQAVSPAGALQALRTSGTSGPGLNAYPFGGYLIFHGVPTFVDGRTDLFGDRFLRAYFDAINLTAPDALGRILERHDIRWTLLEPGLPAVALLDHLPGWRRLYADAVSVVHVRIP